jgi:CDP-2,3-bis-(O-geranylgeranyl)-sn-glycerol synthase
MAALDPLACALFVIASFALAGIAQTLWLGSALSQGFAIPLDAGRTFRGKRILGENKTARGFVVMVPAAAAAFALLHRLLTTTDPAEVLGIWPLSSTSYLGLGALAGLGFMLGEIPNSFLKRQLDIPPGEAPRGSLARAGCWLGDRLDSILGMLLAMSLAVPTPFMMWVFVLLIGPGVHWLFGGALYVLGGKRRWA